MAQIFDRSSNALARASLVLTGLIVIQMIVGKVKVRPRMLGKAATVFQMVMVLWILLKWDDKWIIAWTLATGICTGVSGLLYVWDGTRQLSAHPASSPTASGGSSSGSVG